VTKPSQQLGPNWRPLQFDYWRRRGVDALGPSTTQVLLLVLEGCDSVLKLSTETGLSTAAVSGHLNRLKSRGLVHWSKRRTDTIRPTCEYVYTEVEDC